MKTETLALLTPAQIGLLRRMGDGPSLRNGDDGAPMWWLDGGGSVHGGTARALIKKGAIEYCAKWGGHPGVLGYRVTKKFRAALDREAPPHDL